MDEDRSRRSSSSYISASTPETTISTIFGSSSSAFSKMMKIVIAGNNGFAQYLAVCIQSSTPHQFMMLSRRASLSPGEIGASSTALMAQPELQKKGWQVIQTNYKDVKELAYLLTGVDVVISTITGDAQIALIDAAAAANVSRFVPSEFGAAPCDRFEDDPTDGGRRAALLRLRHHEATGSLQFTVFSCGLFYERFAPGGLTGSEINVSGSLGGEGDLLINMRTAQAMTSFRDGSTYVSVTSARDAAQYVVAALSLKHWPRQFCFHAQRLSLVELFDICQRVRGIEFQWVPYDTATLLASLSRAHVTGDRSSEVRYSQLLALAEGKFDLRTTNLDAMVNVSCESFEQWLRRMWSFSP